MAGLDEKTFDRILEGTREEAPLKPAATVLPVKGNKFGVEDFWRTVQALRQTPAELLETAKKAT